MPDIKIREVTKGTIKTLDKGAVASSKLKNNVVSIKNRADSTINQSDNSPEEFASRNITEPIERIGNRTSAKFAPVGKKNLQITKGNLVKGKEKIRDIKTRAIANSKPQTVKKGRSTVKSVNRKAYNTSQIKKKMVSQSVKQSAQASKRTTKTAKDTVRNSKRFARAVATSVKAIITGTKALISAIIAGGWVAIVVILICCLFGAAFYFFGDSSSENYTPVSAEVEAYDNVIRDYAKQYDMSEYVELVKAVMMQESAGLGTDPMQASECAYNKKYPHTAGSIKDPNYSIECGMQQLKDCLELSSVESPVDMEHIRLALQGYNFGTGYITWAIKEDGGYTVANASKFSDEQAKKNGWTSYGDKQYVSHVLRYYPFGSYNYGVGNTLITQVALQEVGNKGGQKFWSWYGFTNHVEWCACFVSWCADQGGYIKEGIIPKFSYVPTGVNWFKDRGQWQKRSYTPASGDIIFFDWEGDGGVDHVGLVERCENGTVYTIEGNSKDECRQKQYAVGSQLILGYGIPKY